MARLVTALLLLCATLSAQDDPWKSLRFLMGTWQAKTQGGSAAANSSGVYTFQLELKNHVMARHTAGVDCKGPADFDCDHSDLLYIYPGAAGQPMKAVFFDNEGHVIQYTITTPAPNQAIFTSDAAQSGPQFRLAYELKGRIMEGKFQMRMPGQTDFKSYLEWAGEKASAR